VCVCRVRGGGDGMGMLRLEHSPSQTR
jgi:hypothetical protein